MAASPDENSLVESCVNGLPFAWEEFVDYFLPIVVQAIQQLNSSQPRKLTAQQTEELAATVFDRLCENNYDLMKKFKPPGTFRTYLLVITYRAFVQAITTR